VAIRVPTFGQETLIPPAAQNPGSGGLPGGGGGDKCLDFPDRSAVVQLYLVEDLAGHQEMVMGVNDSWNEYCAVEVFDVGAGCGQAHHLIQLSPRDNHVPGRCYCVGRETGPTWINDPAIDQDSIRNTICATH
jgi:hypothetical protein